MRVARVRHEITIATMGDDALHTCPLIGHTRGAAAAAGPYKTDFLAPSIELVPTDSTQLYIMFSFMTSSAATKTAAAETTTAAITAPIAIVEPTAIKLDECRGKIAAVCSIANAVTETIKPTPTKPVRGGKKWVVAMFVVVQAMLTYIIITTLCPIHYIVTFACPTTIIYTFVAGARNYFGEFNSYEWSEFVEGCEYIPHHLKTAATIGKFSSSAIEVSGAISKAISKSKNDGWASWVFNVIGRSIKNGYELHHNKLLRKKARVERGTSWRNQTIAAIILSVAVVVGTMDLTTLTIITTITITQLASTKYVTTYIINNTTVAEFIRAIPYIIRMAKGASPLSKTPRR